MGFGQESATDSPYIYYFLLLVHRFREFTVKTRFDIPGRFSPPCHLIATLLFIVFCQVLIKWRLAKDMKLSFPNSWYSFSWQVHLIAPVMGKDALYWTASILYWTIHFLAHHRLHHHSRDGDLQKNGRLLMTQSEGECYSVYE